MLSRMLYQNILADEICVYACAIFLNIHITIDYLHGFWTTLDLSDLNHDLAISLSEVDYVTYAAPWTYPLKEKRY